MALLETQQANPETKEKADQAIPLVEQIVESCGVLDCNALVELYQPKFNENPNDVVFLKKVLKTMKRKIVPILNCCGQISEKLYSLEPSPTLLSTWLMPT
jgi:hypothetical protein